MTAEEKKQIVDDVLFLLRKSSKSIEQLEETKTLEDTDCFEISRGRKILAKSFAEMLVEKYISQQLDERYLSSQHDDYARGRMFFQNSIEVEKTACVGDFVDSLTEGSGTGMDASGRIQADRVEVRKHLTVLDIIMNEIKVMAGEFSFSDCGKIDKVEYVSEGTYKLWMFKETDTDITNLQKEDVLLSIVNNMKTGGHDYYSSWFRCLSSNTAENSLMVVLYSDREVPGGKNFPPVAGYNVTRKGNAIIPKEGEVNQRSQSWFLSSNEGRIVFLTNVYKPILEEFNYSISIGSLPDIKAFRDLDIVGDMGVYAKTVACEHLYEIDWNGDVKPSLVDRGNWSLETAQSASPYRYRDYKKFYPDNKHKFTVLEQHTVYHYGCKWGCLSDKTEEEPKWNAKDWIMLEGDPNYYLDFESSDGWSFFPSTMDTIITAIVSHGNREITDVLLHTQGADIEWVRDTGNIPNDNTWTPTYVDGNKSKIHLTAADMGIGWGSEYRIVKITCIVYIPIGESNISIRKSINVKN